MSEFRVTLFAITPLLVSIAIVMLGAGLLGTVLSVRMAIEGFPVDRIGIIMACYSVGFVIGTRICPTLIGRVGHVRAFAAFAAMCATTALVHALLVDQLVWAFLRIISGFCLAGLFMVTESWLNVSTSNTQRGRVLSIYMVVTYLALGSSQILLMTNEPTGFELFSLIAILITIALVPLALTRVQSPGIGSIPSFSIRRLLEISPLGVVGCFAAGVMTSAFSGLAPVYAGTIDPSITFIAQFMTLAILSGLLFQVPLGRLSDRFDRRSVILGITTALAIVSALIALLAGFGLIINLALVVIFAGITYALYPVALSHASDYLEPSDVVPAMAGLLFVFGAGSIIGPVTAAFAMTALGPRGLFVFVAGVATIMSLFAVWRMRSRPPLPADQQGQFVVFPITTTAVATELDPRGQDADDQLSFDFRGQEETPTETATGDNNA